ncbi:hypothetical protein MK079_02515, partial [Candidatus Gracilibacteria bacterium]|nr:hypothetical protein [Candidatus Gracilibacteria bacterium]
IIFMSAPAKINLSALQQSFEQSNRKKAPKSETPTVSQESHAQKIDVPTKKEASQVGDKNKPVHISQTNHVQKEDQASTDISQNKDTKLEQKKEDETTNSKDIKKQKSSEDLFQNYQSIFTREQENILQRIKKIKIVKTRPQLVFGLIGITSMIIATLFYLDPQRHSLTAYKTSILNNYYNISGNTAPQEEEVPDIVPPQIIPTVDNTPSFRSIIVMRRVYEAEIIEEGGQEIWLYQGQKFADQQELETYLKKQISRNTKQKIIEHISNK